MNKIIFSVFSFFFSISPFFAQSDYEKGWKAFQKNNREEARKYFSQDTSNPEAMLSLALIDLNENKLNEAFLNFTRFYESSPNPYPYLYAVSSLPFLSSNGKVTGDKKMAFFEKIINDPKMNGTLKSMIYGDMGDYYFERNNTRKAEENYSKIAAIENWEVLGTFDNISGSGFDKDWGAVDKSRNEDVFKNSVNADVNWYYPGKNSENKWFYFDYYFYLNDAIIYAQSFVNSPITQEAYLRAGNSGSLKIWVNDALVSSVSDERNCDLDIYAYKVKLNAGTNRLLVQIGTGEIERANFLIRLTDENGNPLPGITSSEKHEEYSKSAEIYDTKELPFFAEEFFIDKIKMDKKNPLNYLLLAETYLRNDKAYEGTKTLKALEEINGKSTLVAYKLYEAYIRSKNHTDTEKEIEYIKKNDPNSFHSLSSKYSDAIQSEKYTEAEDICNQTIQMYGDSETTDGWRINLASFQKKFEDVISLSKEMYKKYPSSYQYMYLNSLIEQNVSKNPRKAISIIENYLKKYRSSDALTLLANLYFEQGNAAKGLAALNKRSNEKPYATGYYHNTMTMLSNMQQYNEALKISEKEMKLTPFLPDVYIQRGYIFKNLNMTEEAKSNFRKAIYYAPTSYDARTQLRLLEKSKEIFLLFPESNLQELIAKAPSQAEYPDDNSVVILNEKQQVIYPEGAKEYRYDLATKILNKSGIEEWKEYAIGYNGYWQKLIVDKAEVIKSNGTISKAETNDNRIVFTNLEVNDVLHLEYRMQDLSGGKLAMQFFDDFKFQYGVPIIKSKFSLLLPEDKKFNFSVKNANIQPSISKKEDMSLYTWEMENVPAVKSEPYMGTLADIAPTLHYSSISNWKYVSDWYKDLTFSKFKTDYVLKETYNKLLKNNEKASKLEKAKIFYHYILENITYSSVDFMQSNYIPQKASRTITTRLGDCKDLSTLFVSLCRMADIDANLVLILTRQNGTDNLIMPTVNFNHAIAQLNIDNKTYYLELTDNSLPFGAIPGDDLNAQILPIPFNGGKENSSLIKLDISQRPINQSVRTHNIIINGNDMEIKREKTSYGATASIVRNRYKALSSDEQLKRSNETIAANFIVPAKVSDLQFSELTTLTDSVSEKYTITVVGALQEVAGMKIFRFPWSDINSLDIVASETRKYPMRYWSYQHEDRTLETIILTLPKGKKLVEIPENKRFECANGIYSLTFDTKNPNQIVAKRYFERTKDVVSVEDYPKFRDFLNNVSESDNRQFALK